jgi:hypothetical protein
LLLAWLTLLPVCTPLPVMAQRRAMIDLFHENQGGRRQGARGEPGFYASRADRVKRRLAAVRRDRASR